VFTVYSLFKFLHIVAVILWVGGVFTVGILNARIARTGERSAMAALGQQSAAFGRTLIGPAAGTALVSGLVMIVDGGIEFTTLWVLWGLIALVLSMFLGSGPIRRAGEELAHRSSNPESDGARVAALRNRLRSLNAVNLVIIFSAVWAMVFKPTL
jgi:uncharacterized membrane protein